MVEAVLFIEISEEWRVKFDENFLIKIGATLTAREAKRLIKNNSVKFNQEAVRSGSILNINFGDRLTVGRKTFVFNKL